MSDLFHEALVIVLKLAEALSEADNSTKPENRALIEEAKEFLRQNPYLKNRPPPLFEDSN
jgi:hypothetical protein